MGIKVRGVKQSKAGLNRIINDVKGRKVVRALQSAMIIGSSCAALYTPIDTSTLLNSQYRELINNGVRLTGRVGYTANYAVFVHDPNVPQPSVAPPRRKSSSPKALKTPAARLMP